MTKHSAAPVIAAVLLLLPVLYVGSYLALVVPGGYISPTDRANDHGGFYVYRDLRYRMDSEWPRKFCWPLEQIDRRLRPAAWG